MIAPVFKLLGIIDQWGNGLKLIADEMKAYPEIEFRWKEVGLSFQVQFVKRNFKAEIESRQELGQEFGQERKEKTMFTFILIHLQQESLSRSELANALGLKTISGHLNRTIAKLKEHGLIKFTIPNKPNHPDQKFRITERGIVFIELVKK
jgi:ATP-dependent DNA helicase RecG